MNVVEFWKSITSECHHYNDFGDGEDFIKKLDENIPDWRQQVRDKNLWPGLHSYSNNVAETYYTNVIIREAGLDFAYYLIQNQWGKKHLDASLALDFCCDNINLWNSFPDYVKEKILNNDNPLRVFLNECLNNSYMWQSLTEKQKSGIFDRLAMEEEKYVSDLLLFKIWADELNYNFSPFLRFETDHFTNIAEDIIQHNNYDDVHLGRMIELQLERWDIPQVHLMHNEYLSYTPSEKLRLLKNVIESSKDEASIAVIDKITNSIQNRLVHRFH